MIRTIVLEYANVLATAAPGNNMLPKNMNEILGTRNTFALITSIRKLPELMKKAMEHLEQNQPKTEEEEFDQFVELYRTLFGGCGIKKDLDSICRQLAHCSVFGEHRMVLCDDALRGVEALKALGRVLLVADTFPSIKRTLTESDVFPLLEGTTFSCDHGVMKNQTALLELAAQEHGIDPAQCLFVNGSETQLEQANALGYQCLRMDRDNKAEESAFPLAHDLAEVAAFLQAQAELSQ